MSEYVPSTEEVLAAASHHGGGTAETIAERRREVERWLSGVKAEAMSIALLDAARTLAGEFTPLVNREPDWRAAHSQLLAAARALSASAERSEKPDNAP